MLDAYVAANQSGTCCRTPRETYEGSVKKKAKCQAAAIKTCCTKTFTVDEQQDASNAPSFASAAIDFPRHCALLL